MRFHFTNRRALAAAILAGAAASGACETSGLTDVTPGTTPRTVAFIGMDGTAPALFMQDADGGGRQRIHFTGADDPIEGNIPEVPPVTDENLLALGPISWSPDGERLAVVATTAYDQSEVVVLDADGTNARIASPNTQIILTNVSWSPDGKRLAYGMSTLPEAGGVDLFVTDLETNRVERLTQGAGIGGGGVAWDASGTGVYTWKMIGSSAGSDPLSRISRVDAASGAAAVLADSVVGRVQGVAGTGAWFVALRDRSQAEGEDWVRDLVRVPLRAPGNTLVLARGYLLFGRLSAGDRRVLVATDAEPSLDRISNVSSLVPIEGGQPVRLEGLEPTVYSVDVRYE